MAEETRIVIDAAECIRSAPLPDLVVLRNMDEHDVGTMRARLAMGRGLLRSLDPSMASAVATGSLSGPSTTWRMSTTDRRQCSLTISTTGVRMSFHATIAHEHFSIDDRQLPPVPATTDDDGTALADALLDRTEALLALPRMRDVALRRAIAATRGGTPQPEPIPADAAARADAVSGVLRRWRAVLAQWGRDGAESLALRLDPPSPLHPGRLLTSDDGHAAATAAGLRLLLDGLGTAVDLVMGGGESTWQVMSPTDVPNLIPAREIVDAMEALRSLADPRAEPGALLLAPRLRRKSVRTSR